MPQTAIDFLKDTFYAQPRVYCVQLAHPRNSDVRKFRVFAIRLEEVSERPGVYRHMLDDIAWAVAQATGLKVKDGVIFGKGLAPADIAYAIDWHVFNGEPGGRQWVTAERM